MILLIKSGGSGAEFGTENSDFCNTGGVTFWHEGINIGYQRVMLRKELSVPVAII